MSNKLPVEDQKKYLNDSKKALGFKTWDAFADAVGVKPKSFMNYRMPAGSSNYSTMPTMLYKLIECMKLEKGSA